MEVSIAWVFFGIWYIICGIGFSWVWRKVIEHDASKIIMILLWPILLMMLALFDFDK